MESCPRLAAFMSWMTFMQYHGFGLSHARVLLAQQYDIERLEDELNEIDRWDACKDSFLKLSSQRRDDYRSRIEDMPADYP
jgi:hypothetical protein